MRKQIDFIGKKKIFFAISLTVILLGLAVNLIFGTELSISFRGGARISYSYSGEDISLDEAKSLVGDTIHQNVTVQRGSDLQSGEETLSNLVIDLPGTDALSAEDQDAITKALREKYPDQEITMTSLDSVNPTIGTWMLSKGLYTIALCSVFLIIYVAIRFRKIGGWAAGAMAVIAVIHDVIIAYLVYVVFRIPLDDNFIAVVLTILGYSLNDTIVIYDRIRENRRYYENKKPIREIANMSLNQCLTRSLNTTISTFIAITTIAVVCAAYGLTSIMSFAIPMAVGIAVGCYTSLCIAIPLWVTWEERPKKDKKKGSRKKKTA